MLMALAIQRPRMASGASPAPRRVLLTRNSRKTPKIPPNVMAVKRRAAAHDRRGSAHEPEQPRRVPDADDGDHGRDGDSNANGVQCGHRRAIRIFFADAPRHHRNGRHAKTHRNPVDDGQHAFGQADSGYGVGSQARHEEHVDDGEQRFHRHLEHHRHGEQQYGAADATFGEILARAKDGGADVAQEGARRALG